MLKKFNIRVYGLLIENDNVLVVDEIVRGNPVTKFPGGGLELGEGPKECLVREFKEETGINVQVTRHFYTTDFFQQSAFNPDDQIISIYYVVENSLGQKSDLANIPFEDHQSTETILAFRWIKLTALTEQEVTLPIDKWVVRKLLEAGKNETL